MNEEKSPSLETRIKQYNLVEKGIDKLQHDIDKVNGVLSYIYRKQDNILREYRGFLVGRELTINRNYRPDTITPIFDHVTPIREHELEQAQKWYEDLTSYQDNSVKNYTDKLALEQDMDVLRQKELDILIALGRLYLKEIK